MRSLNGGAEQMSRAVRMRNMILQALLQLVVEPKDDRSIDLFHQVCDDGDHYVALTIAQIVFPWLMCFIRFGAHPSTVVLSLKIIAHLLLTRPFMVSRFKQALNNG